MIRLPYEIALDERERQHERFEAGTGRCSCCGRRQYPDDRVYVLDAYEDFVCDLCIDDEIGIDNTDEVNRVCRMCHNHICEDKAYEADGKVICIECLKDHYTEDAEKFCDY